MEPSIATCNTLDVTHEFVIQATKYIYFFNYELCIKTFITFIICFIYY